MNRAAWVMAFLVGLAGCYSIDVGPAASGRAYADEPSSASDGDEQALALSLDNNGGGWLERARQIGRIASGITLGADQGILLTAYDTLALPGKPVDLTVNIRSAEHLQSVEGVTFAFHQGGELLGQAVSDNDGNASIRYQANEPGDYRVTVKLQAVPEEGLREALQAEPVDLLVACRPAETEFVVVDLDRTVVGSSFARVLLGLAEPMPQSVEVLSLIADRLSVIYLTHRPDLMTHRSKNWLGDNGYPVGPLLTSTLTGAIGDSGEFKTARLAELLQTYPNVKLGIGDKISDARSYADNGITAYLIPYYKDDPKDMRRIGRQIRRLPDSVEVTPTWRDVHAAFFEEKEYPPRRYARRLMDQADRLQRQRQRDEDEKEEQDDNNDEDEEEDD